MKNENYRAGYSFEKMLKYFFIVIAICILISILLKYLKDRRDNNNNGISPNMVRAEISNTADKLSK